VPRMGPRTTRAHASTNFWPKGGGGWGVEHLANWVINLVANGDKFREDAADR